MPSLRWRLTGYPGDLDAAARLVSILAQLHATVAQLESEPPPADHALPAELAPPAPAIAAWLQTAAARDQGQYWFLWSRLCGLTEPATWDLAFIAIERAAQLMPTNEPQAWRQIRRQRALVQGHRQQLAAAIADLTALIAEVRDLAERDDRSFIIGGGWSYLANLYQQRAQHYFGRLQYQDALDDLAINQRQLVDDWLQGALPPWDTDEPTKWFNLHATMLWQHGYVLGWQFRLADLAPDTYALRLNDAECVAIEIEDLLDELRPQQQPLDRQYGLHAELADLALAQFEFTNRMQPNHLSTPHRARLLSKAQEHAQHARETLPIAPNRALHLPLLEILELRIACYTAEMHHDGAALAATLAALIALRTRLAGSANQGAALVIGQTWMVIGHCHAMLQREEPAQASMHRQQALYAYDHALVNYHETGVNAPRYLVAASERSRDWLLTHP